MSNSELRIKKNGAEEEIRSILEQLPDEEFETPVDVSQAVGKIEN